MERLTLCDTVFYPHLPDLDITKASRRRLKPSEILSAALHDLPFGQSLLTTSANHIITPSPRAAFSSATTGTLMLFKAVLPNLENTQHLILISPTQTDPQTPRAAPSISSQLTADIWATVGANLRLLTLNMSIDKLGEIMRVAPHQLNALRELHISIEPRHDCEPAEECQRVLANAVAPFVNHLVPQLTVLSFKAICFVLNLDPFFRGIGPTPQLRRLDLCLAWPHRRRKWSVEALEVFLRDHGMVKDVDVKYEKCSCLWEMRNVGRCDIQ